MNTVMATRPVEIGPTGLQTARNVERLRTALGVSQRRLAEILTGMGRPMPTTALSKIERGERRVDADDLVAIAIALGVSPATLLLPPVADATLTQVTGVGQVPSRSAWDWADGVRPLLPFPTDVPGEAAKDSPLAYAQRARPEGRPAHSLPATEPSAAAGESGPFGECSREELIQLLDNVRAALFQR